MSRYFSNPHTYNEVDPSVFEHPQGETMTVPDQTLSLRTLVERYTRGQSVPLLGGAVFVEDDDVHLDKMDLTDRLHFKQNVEAFIVETRDDLAASRAARAKAKADTAAAAAASAAPPSPPLIE